MNWQEFILEQARPGDDVPALVERLFERQRESWPLLTQGLASLSQMRTRKLTRGSESIMLQSNPGRSRSTNARVDPQSIAQRPCFLCPQNMPRQERGVSLGDYVILPNPFPILPQHCTIPAREHKAQALAGRFSDLWLLAQNLGPDMLVFYNGPRCGASAPDHFHFQACRAEQVPLVDELIAVPTSEKVHPLHHFGRRILLASHPSREESIAHLKRSFGALDEGQGPEPMVNLLALYRNGRYLSALIPRAAHRPRCFFKEDPDRIAISPAALEMAGILVVAQAHHFHLVDPELAYSIYREVSLSDQDFKRWIERIS